MNETCKKVSNVYLKRYIPEKKYASRARSSSEKIEHNNNLFFGLYNLISNSTSHIRS